MSNEEIKQQMSPYRSTEKKLVEDHEAVSNEYEDFTQEMFDEAFTKHLLWLNSNGSKGEQMDLEDCDLTEFNFEHINLTSANMNCACFRRVSFVDCNIHRACLGASDFEDANFGYRMFSTKKLTYLSSNDINQTKFSFGVKEPWHIMRREYSGAMLLVTFVAAAASFIPYILEAVIWYSLDAINKTKNVLPDSVNTVDTSIIAHILGFNREYAWLHVSASLILIFYNACRFWITKEIAKLNQMAADSFTAPPIQTYKLYFLVHFWVLRPIFYFTLISIIIRTVSFVTNPVTVPLSN